METLESDDHLGLEATSAARLRTSRAYLSEIALACGFADQSHFSQEFRKYFRATARQYHLVMGSG